MTATSQNKNTIPGSHRQRARSSTGEDLERAYIYLTPAVWEALYEASARAGLPASKYLATLIPTQEGTHNIKDKNDPTTNRKA